MGQLESFDDVSPETKRAYATHFRVVGKTCSLLMLETEADYEQYGIVPRQDAERVRTSSARHAIARAAVARGRTAADARLRFLGRLRSMLAAAGLEGGLSEELETLLSQEPDTAFAIRPAPLSSRRGRALHALSTLVEKSPGDVSLLRDVAFRAQAWGFGGHAFYLLRRAATLRPAPAADAG